MKIGDVVYWEPLAKIPKAANAKIGRVKQLMRPPGEDRILIEFESLPRGYNGQVVTKWIRPEYLKVIGHETR